MMAWVVLPRSLHYAQPQYHVKARERNEDASPGLGGRRLIPSGREETRGNDSFMNDGGSMEALHFCITWSCSSS
jgi:hypothetical protein